MVCHHKENNIPKSVLLSILAIYIKGAVYTGVSSIESTTIRPTEILDNY